MLVWALGWLCRRSADIIIHDSNYLHDWLISMQRI